MDVTTTNHVQRPQNHLLHDLFHDLLIYVFNFLQIESIIQLKLTSKYLNKIINANNQSYHYFHMQTLETIFSKSDDGKKYQLMECFKSIKSLETVINLNRIFPIAELKQNDEYKKSKLFQELPPKSFYEDFVTRFLSQLHRLEGLTVNGCFDDVAIKLPFQPRLKSMTVRNTESSSLLSSFFHTLLTSQFNINTSTNTAYNNLKHDKNHLINAWCQILNKAGNHTLCSLKVLNFVASLKTLFKLSRFENLSSLQIQYDSIDYDSNKDIMADNADLAEEIAFLKSKMRMITDSDIELFVCLLFKNIVCLENVSIAGEESANMHLFDGDNNSLSLLMLYYVLYFQGANLHSLSVRICIESELKYQYHYKNMQIYHKIINCPFRFNVKYFNSVSIALVTPENEEKNDENTNEKEIDGDMDDIIIKYGNATKRMEYISTLPLSIQSFVSIFERFKCCLDEYYMEENMERFHINNFDLNLESAYKHFGYYYGFMIAKGIYSFHPRVVTITSNLLELDMNDSELFINTLQSIAKWLCLFIANKCSSKRLKLIQTLKISVSCIRQISVKKLSEFCVGDGNDERLINALQIFAKDLCVENIDLQIETMSRSDDTDKLRYYIRMQKHVKSIGFKIDLKPNDTAQSLVISYNAK